MIGHTQNILFSLSLMAAGAMTISTSAFTQHRRTGSVIPYRSSILPQASEDMDESKRGQPILGRPLNSIHNPSLKKHLNNNSKLFDQVETKNSDDNDDDNDWELRLYDDDTKTWEEVADVLVQVTGSSDPDAFKIMMQANKNGHTRIGKKLCYQVAALFNEGLQKQGILSEIVQVIDNGNTDTDNVDDFNSEWE